MSLLPLGIRSPEDSAALVRSLGLPSRLRKIYWGEVFSFKKKQGKIDCISSPFLQKSGEGNLFSSETHALFQQ